MFNKRKIKRNIKSIRFDLIEKDPLLAEYRTGGEYQALLWLKAFTEDRTAATPRQLLRSILRNISRGTSISNTDSAIFALTLFPYI